MDKRGNFPTAEELLCSLPEKEIDEVPRKVTLSEYLSSPEFQRKRKIESERTQRSAFEKKMAFRSAQEQNPVIDPRMNSGETSANIKQKHLWNSEADWTLQRSSRQSC